MNDLVTILLDHDDTEEFSVTPLMTRWEAELLLRTFGEYGLPYNGRRVTKALIVAHAEGPIH